MFERMGREPTQGEVGAAVGVKANAVSAWESGGATPPIETIAKVAAALGVTAGWLAFGQEPRYAEAPGRGRGVRVAEDDLEPRGVQKTAARKRGAR